MARLYNKALSEAKWAIIIGVLLFFVASYCLRIGKIWIPRTTEFAERNSDPRHFWLGVIMLYGISAWIIGRGLTQLHKLGII